MAAMIFWFKRQLFGERSEKRLLIDPAVQADLLAGLGVDVDTRPAVLEKETISYERKKPRNHNCVNDQGLRFDDTVPVQTIEVGADEALAGIRSDQLEQVSAKVSYRLAQRPGSYVVLKYVRPVFKRRDKNELISTTAPANVLDKSLADVSFLAGMLVDKFCYHLPLYRQHHLVKVPLLIIDDFGLKPLRHPHDEDFHDLIAERYERAATVITSNLDFGEWGDAFPNQLLGAATLDRLRHAAYRVVLDGKSYRSPRPLDNQLEKQPRSGK